MSVTASSNVRGKTTPASTGGSFAPKSGRASRLKVESDDQPHADSTCAHCGLDVFFDSEDRVWRHAESESEGCGSHAPDGDDGTSATPGGTDTWTSDDGSVSTVRTRDGVAHDGPNGEPARVDTYPDGTVVTTRMRDGVITDGVNGEPAVDARHADGTIETLRYQAGKKVVQ